MYLISLTQSPNQSVSFNADGALWTVKVYQAVTHMCADVSLNGVKLIDGVRCFGGIKLLQYDYMTQPDFGNLVFDTDGDWTNFGSSCNLYYLDSDEIVELEAAILAS